MLTVFHANTAALALYNRLGYVLDDDSPGAVDPSGDHKYEILTKRLPAPAGATKA
jgi:RimJ/RimL family protein N-acetyltransferase